MRAAKRLGDDDLAIVKACAAVKGDADKALGQLNDVPEDARGDLGYVLCRVKWAMKKDKIVEAANADDRGSAGDHGAAGHRRMVARPPHSRRKLLDSANSRWPMTW